MLFWIVTPCGLGGRYKLFGESYWQPFSPTHGPASSDIGFFTCPSYTLSSGMALNFTLHPHSVWPLKGPILCLSPDPATFLSPCMETLYWPWPSPPHSLLWLADCPLVWPLIWSYFNYSPPKTSTSALKMKTVCFSERLASTYEFSRCHNPEE
jgi:hypothetical protein